jgi:hypothetical protein
VLAHEKGARYNEGISILVASDVPEGQLHHRNFAVPRGLLVRIHAYASCPVHDVCALPQGSGVCTPPLPRRIVNSTTSLVAGPCAAAARLSQPV